MKSYKGVCIDNNVGISHGEQGMRVSSRCDVEDRSEFFQTQANVWLEKLERADNVDDEQDSENECV